MIQSFQKFSNSVWAKIFLAVVALSFITFFGGGSLFRKDQTNAVVAEVGSVKISGYELGTKVQEQAKYIISQAPQPITQEDLLKAGLPHQVLDQLVQITLLNLEAARLGLTVTDESLRKRIHSLKAFQDATGVFSHARFTQILRASGFSEDSFLNNVREEVIREQLSNAIMAGVRLPFDMVGPLFNIQFQQRQASLVKISPKDLPPPPPPSTKTLEAFYKKHEQAFTAPELRTITALVLDPSQIAKAIPVTEADIKAVYENRTDKEPLEKVRTSIIAGIQKERATEQLYKLTQELDDKIAGGATFEELATQAKNVSLIKLEMVTATGLAHGENPSSQLPKDNDFAQELLQNAFTLEAKTDSPFIQAKNGTYYAVRVENITPQTLHPFSKKQAFVLKIWKEAEQFKMAQAKAQEQAKACTDGKKTLAGAVALPALSLSEPSPAVPDIIKDLVFSLRPGQAGTAVLPDGIAVVVLNSIVPPTPQMKDEKLAQFRSILLNQYKNDVLAAYINALHVRYHVKINRDLVQNLYTKSEPTS